MLLDIHVIGKDKKNFLIYMLRCIFYKKNLWETTWVGLHTDNPIFLTRPW